MIKLEEFQRRHSLELLLNSARWAVACIAHWAVAWLLVWAISDAIPLSVSIPWAVILSSVTLFQVIYASHGQARIQTQASDSLVSRTLRTYTWSAWIFGLCWAVAPVLLFPVQYPELQLFLVFVVGGVSLAAVGTQHVYLPACYGSMGFMVPALAVRYVLEERWIESLLLVVYYLLLLSLARRLFHSTINTMRLQHQRDELLGALREGAHKLEEAKLAADEANLAKSRFLAQASHDLRQPLHAIGLFAETLSDNKDPKTRQIVDRMQESIGMLSNLFASLLDISVLDAGKTQPLSSSFYLQQLFQQVRKDFEPLAEQAGVSLRFRDTRAVIKCDQVLLRRMLQNLISNAIHYAPNGEVLVGRRWEGERSCAIDVIDNGPGIPETDQHIVFNEFVRLQASNEQKIPGLGLGLTIVARLAKVLNLHVGLDSQPGHGTRFRISGLTVSNESVTPLTEKPVQDARNRLTGTRLLIVDDDEEVLNATSSLLARWGCEVVACTQFPDSLPNVQMVLCDYELKNDDGLTRLRRIARDHPQVTLILISGNSSPQLKRQAAELSIPLLHKPVRPVQLRSLLLRCSS